MQIFIVKEKIAYDGSQLTSHFALTRFGLKGDALVVFRGPMDVLPDKIVDQEDRLSGSAIRSNEMLHFIAEFFGANLEATVLKQRLLARLAADLIREECGTVLEVKGDDLYLKAGKLSVSIAAPSPISCLIHFGLNIVTEGVPVEALSLTDLSINPDWMAKVLARSFQDEMESIHWATAKVRGVP